MTGNIVVAGDANLKAANIKKNTTIFGVKGTFQGYVDAPLYLFNLGTLGGRLKEFIKHDSGSLSSMFDKHISLYSTNNSSNYYTSNPTIDLTEYNYLYVLATYGSDVSATMVMSVGKNIDIKPVSDAVKIEGRVSRENGRYAPENATTLKLDISKLSGYHYIKFGSGNGALTAFHIFKLWFDNV